MGVVALLHPSQDYPNDNFIHTSNPNFTTSQPRKRTNKSKMLTHPPLTKTLVMEHVKILKRGEPLDQSSLKIHKTTLKNDANVTGDQKVKSLSKKKKKEKTKSKRVEPFAESSSVLKIQKTTLKNDTTETKDVPFCKEKTNLNTKAHNLKPEDFDLCSTNRLGPDPELMSNNMADFFFAGSVFVDSPPPSSVPLPGFFTKNCAKEDPTTDLRRMLGLS
ncbi:hypothetical protein QVD17_18876 [Tagetes erecta]|uniref:Uncharacterized protein n=1 Tax=Tagetes erecta TaxID=13708 RepID=A0AAD8NWF5_TARER|nr:hypothetical protein QVD17_18876 [Tagetes erecta]